MKKILFMSTAKLTTISIGLLLAVFCTIGMSFTPVEEEVVEIANDSTSVSGPQKQLKKSHWTTTESSGCSTTTTYHNKIDYAKTIAQSLGNGTVAITENSKNATPVTAADGSTSYVEWNSGLGENGEKDEATLKAAHTNTITFAAEPSDPQEYRFAGWYSDASGNTRVSTDNPWETTVAFADATGITKYGTEEVTTYQSSPWTKTYYAKFEVIPAINVTFLAASTPSKDNGSYMVVGKNLNQTITTSNQTIGVKGVALTATPSEAAEFVRWFTQDGGGNRTTLSTENPYNAAFTAETTVGVEWKELTNNHNLTFKAVELDANDNPVGTYTVNSTMVSTSDYNYNTGAAYKFQPTMTATPVEGYMFTGWYAMHGKRKELLSKDNPWMPSFSQDSVICAGFLFNDYTDEQKAQFKVGSNYYLDLNEANTAAKNGSNKTIVCARDGILPPGEYEISSGVTLYIPYSTSESSQTKPAEVTTAETLSAYRTLTFAKEANVIVASGGKICVGGKIMAAGGGSKSAYVTGPCGVINMANGGHIELNGTLYCWGLIKGQDMDQGNNTLDVGTITANAGSVVWEDFAVGDWRGGTATSAINNKKSSWKLFPFQSYSIQNIEVPTTYKYGAKLSNYVDINSSYGTEDATFDIVGSSGTLFLLKNNQSTVRKWYDPTTDLTCYELNGTAQLDALNIYVYISVSSADFYLPISNSMHIIINCDMTLSKPMTMQAGSVIEITNNATVNLEARLHMFDKDEWGLYIHDYYFRSFNNLTNHKDRGAENSNAGLDDAKLIIDGTLNVVSGKGYIYSTNGGANIMGNGGGKVVFGGALPSGTESLHHVNTGTKAQSYIQDSPNDIAAANLCNEDGSYTKSIASTTFHNVHGRWFAASAKDEKSNHTYDFTYISSGAVSGTSGTNTTTDAVYSNDKTGLEAQMKWANVTADDCANWWQGQGDQTGWFYNWTMNSDWHQFIPMASPTGWYSGSDNHLYEKQDCNWEDVGETDEDCLYTIGGIKKALVEGELIQLEKNAEDEAFHDVANPSNYYICFEGCNWHPAAKYPGQEKAYIVEEDNFIWFENNWLNVERKEPFFYSLDETNVPVYYEYVEGAWVLASYKVKVVDALETRRFYFINEAFTVANGKKNTTITLLKDIPTITAGLTYSAKNTTCTLDLNGHILPGSISSMLKIDASGSTFTITDNSEDKLGRIQLTVDDNARRYCVNLTAGSLILNAGTISAVNTKAYDKANSITTTQSCGLIVKTGMTFTMNGGRIEAFAAHNPWGIYVEASTSSGGTITINGGTVHSETTQISSPYGIYGYGTWNINSGATIEAVAQTTSACALYVEATTNKYFGTLNLKGGTINATSTTNTATGVFVNGVYIMAKTTPNTISSTYRAVANITGGTITVVTNGTTTAYGIQSRGTTTIANATVNVTPKSTTGYGLLVQDGTTTINSGTFNINATTTAKGIYANGAQPDDKTGRPYNPNVIVNGGVFNVTATTSTPSYGIHMDCNIRNITSTASGNYPGIYSSVPTVTVNGGEFYVRSTTKEAWGAYVGRTYRFETGTNTVAEWYRPTLTINDGTFEVTTGSGANAEAIRSYGTTHVNGGDFTATAKTSAAYGFRVMDGIGTTSGNPKFTVKATTTNAYGAVADITQPGEKTGLPCQGDLTIGGGTFDVDAVTSDAYGLYVNASGRVITSTADGYYPGDYSSIGRATVNSGTFNVTTTTLNAIGAYVKRDVQANRYVSKGELTINDGDFTVATSVQTKGKNCIGVWTYGTTTINGGTFDVTAANSTTAANGYYAFGVYALDGNTVINNSPEFTVKAYANSYGVYANADQANATTGLTSNSNVTINGGTYNVSTTGTTGAIGAIVSVPAARVITSGDYAGDYYSSATMTINAGTFNVEAATTTATGAYAGRNYISANTMPNTFSKYNYGNLIIHGGEFNVSTNGTSTADGVKSHGTTLIDGGTFNVTPKSTTAYGVRVYAGKTTINETAQHSPEFNVTATTTAYGVMAGGGEAPNAKTGLCYDGEVEVNAGTFNVETTSDKPAYGVYVYLGSAKITSTSSGYYRGNYAYAGTATINGGEFNVTSKKTEAYGIFVPAGATQSGATAYDPASATPKCTVNGGKFWINGTANKIYMTNTKALPADYKIYGGYYGGTSNVTYGLSGYVVSPKQIITLNDQNANYPKYTYKVGDGATITWKNGSTTLTSTPNLFELGIIPVYYGATPTKDSDAQYTYTFDGWSTTDGGNKLASLPAISADATYYAHYATTLQSYDVTFNLQGHGDAITSQTKDYGSKVDKPTDPTADGWIFGGWFKEAACTNEWDFSDDEVQGTTELFAKWTMDGIGPKLDIVDWTSSTLTINMNGIPAAGWNYTIKVGELESHTYAKDDRDDDRTLTVDYKDEIHIPNPDTQLRIVVTKGNAEVYSSHNYIIPHVYSSNNAKLDNVNTVDENGNSILVVNSGTLEITTSVKVNAIYVAPGAELKVDKSVTLTVDSLMLRTTPWEAAILDNQGIISSSKTYYTRKIADNTKYYQFAIPLASDVKNVRLSNNSKCTYNTSWMLKSYNEESRANNGAVNTETISNWDLLTTDGEGHATILGSVGYEMFSNTPYYREYYFPVTLPTPETTEVGVSYHLGEAGKNHAGWNALCSPLMGKYSQTSRDPSERLKISQLNPDGTYQQTAPNIISPAVPFYYQATHNGTIYFNGDAMVFNAPRRAWNAYVPTQWMQLAISNLKGDKLDETSIYAHPEKFAPEYETGYDVAKQSLTGGKALIYSELPCGKLAFAAVPDSLAENRIPITVNANDEGEFLFSLMENNYLGRLQHVLLHDTQNGLVIDLLERDYSAKLNAGTNAGRFYIQCVFAAEAPAVTTGVNSVESNDDAPQKIMYKNKVYIIYQGRVYDMTGRQCELK